MLNLAQIFCLSGFHVTFITSDFAHRRLLRHTSVAATFARYPGWKFRLLPDGLPDDHPRAGERVMEFMSSVATVTFPLFKKMIVGEKFFAADGRRPVTCYVADGLMTVAADFAEENDLPLIYFRTATASYFWAIFRFPELLEAQEIPFNGKSCCFFFETIDKKFKDCVTDSNSRLLLILFRYFAGKSMDGLVKSVPGTEGFLRRRDLPSFYRAGDVNDPILQRVAAVTRQITRAQAAIFNTCEDLEGEILKEMQKHVPRIFAIGPIHEQAKSRLAEKKAEPSIITASLWAEDQSCVEWLDAQPPKSVIYVSFGSITILTREQLLEIWHGLLDSCQRFLWVIRPDSVAGDDRIPAELTVRSKEKGMLVEWAPQEAVLNHPSVGGFLTHSGWNSTLESISAGVPMICWPYFADQTINSRFVSEVWKIGLDIKDSCDRLIVEKAVREVMEERKDEFLERANQVSKLVKKAVSEGGSSYSSMDALIHYIKSLVI